MSDGECFCRYNDGNLCDVCETRIIVERDTLRAENEKSHKAFDSLEESFMKTSKMLTEACMKNKSLYEQFNLWKEERDSLRKEVERLSGKTGFCLQCEGYAKEVERLRGLLETAKEGFTHLGSYLGMRGDADLGLYGLKGYAFDRRNEIAEALSGREGRG